MRNRRVADEATAACLLCCVYSQYVVELIDTSSAIDRRLPLVHDQYVSRITVAPTAISGLRVRASIVTGRREREDDVQSEEIEGALTMLDGQQ